MQRRKGLALARLGSGLAIAALFCSAAWADEADKANDVLTGKKLSLQSGTYVHQDELDLSKAMRDASAEQRKVFVAAKLLNAAEQKEAAAENAIIQMLKARSQIRARLAQTNNVKQQNQMILALQELGDRIVALREGKEIKEELKKARGNFNDVREKYVENLLQARILADSVEDAYARLKADGEVTKALETINKTAEKPYELGPSRTLASSLRSLKRLEDKVLSEKIQMRKGGGDLYYLTVVFDGKYNAEMGIDTGASVISLPWVMAKEVGLMPGPSAETVRVQLADGSIVEGKHVVAHKVRVGKFEVENVDCVVMPENLPKAAPLLGQSFLQHFSYKINSKTDELVMTKVETPQAARRKPRR